MADIMRLMHRRFLRLARALLEYFAIDGRVDRDEANAVLQLMSDDDSVPVENGYDYLDNSHPLLIHDAAEVHYGVEAINENELNHAPLTNGYDSMDDELDR